ncbi:MAG TPA: AAA family ATPase [Chloroflexia bacterium]|nr:AAA family ATPase [Chloroflexia bacterium]
MESFSTIKGICPVLIGRGEAQARLQGMAQQVLRGQGQLVIVKGEAGIGKSRLVAEFKNWTRQLNFLRLEGSCFQTDGAFPYAPWLDLFRTYFAALTPKNLPESLRPVALAFSPLLPELAFLFPELTTTPGSNFQPEEEKRKLFAAVDYFLTWQAARQPVLVVLEDLHWSDDLSLELLLYLARRNRDKPLMLIATFRNDELPQSMRRWLAELDREHIAEEFFLTPLSRQEVASMLQNILGEDQPNGVNLLDSLYALAEGNPFFVEELLKTLLTGGQSAFTTKSRDNPPQVTRTEIPRSIFEAVYLRVSGLSPQARRLLTLAAVAGRRFNITLLQEILQWKEEKLLVLLKELTGAQLVVEESAEQFAFRHALTQQAVVSQILLRERQVLHRSLARSLERLAQSSPLKEKYLEDLAYHCYEAEMWEKALKYSRESGEKALALYAQQAAIEHLTRALKAVRHLGQPPAAELYLARGKAYETLGDFEHAREDYESAREAARATQQHKLEWESILATGYLWTGYNYEQAGEWFQQALGLSEKLGDLSLNAWSLARLGNWYLNKGQIRETITSLEGANRLFERLNERQGMAEALEQLGAAYFFMGDPARGVKEFFGRVIELFRELGNNHSLFYTLAARAMDSSPENLETTFSSLRTRTECLLDVEEALQLARQINSQSGLAFVEMCYSLVQASFGDFGQAFAHAREALRIANAIEHQEWIAATNGILGQIYLLLLEPGQAVSHLEAAIAGAQALGSMIWLRLLTPYLASAYILNKDFERAEATLQKAIPAGQLPADYFERQAFRVKGLLAISRNEPALALQIADMLLETVPGDEKLQPIPHLLALKGEALLSLERFNEAVVALEEARQGAEQRQAPSINWRIRCLLGQAYRQLKRENHAQQEWKVAREIVQKLAATIDEKYLRELFLETTSGLLPAEKVISTPSTLTAREREVAALVASGKTNREIANLLMVSERTAEAHVSNILGKLGFSTRAQIAVWAIEKGSISRP